jgi:hypothetical protein
MTGRCGVNQILGQLDFSIIRGFVQGTPLVLHSMYEAKLISLLDSSHMYFNNIVF